MKRRFKTGLIFAFAMGLLTLGWTSGCYINHSAVKPEELPADWQAALQNRMEFPESFAGTYNNLGVSYGGYVRLPGEKPGRMRDYLWLPPGEDYGHPKPGRTTELVVESRTQLRLITREGSQVLNEQILAVEWDASSHSFIYDKRQTPNGGLGLGGHGLPGGVELEWSSYRLFKGGDDNLYRLWSRESAGLGLFVLPISTTNGSWSRWNVMP
jgi:hypothetical protein